MADSSSEPDPEQSARELAATALAERFDLDADSLFRARLVRLGEDEHLLILALHHIAADGWSMGVLKRDLAQLYAAELEDRPASLPELAVQYGDYAAWQREAALSRRYQQQLEYWRGRLDGAPTSLGLPTDRPRPPVQGTAGAHRRRRLGGELSARLRALGREEDATLFMVLLAGFAALLARHGHQDDVVVGTPVAGRSRVELERLIGFFSNVLALRTDVSGDPTFAELVRRVRDTALEAYEHQDVAFETVVAEVNPARSLSHTPIFQVLFSFQHAGGEPLQLPGVQASIVELERGTAKFDLALFVLESPEGLRLSCEYSTDLFDAQTVDRLLARLETLLQAGADDPGVRLSAIDILPRDERELLARWSATSGDGPAPGLCAHELVERQAARNPDAPAICFGGQVTTYAELLSRARAVASRLVQAGVGAGVPVGISAERSPALIAGVLGILMAGGAYAPLDPAYPAGRLRLMLEDLGAPVLLLGRGLEERVPRLEARVIDLEDAVSPLGTVVRPPRPATLDDLAYVLFTSGSTGRPKGVAMSHRPLANLLAWQLRSWSAPAAARTLQFASLSFDVSFQEIFSTLASGGTLVLISEMQRRDPGALLSVIDDQAVERVFLPFVALQLVADASHYANIVPRALREVICAGEPLHVTPSIRSLFEQLDEAVLHNHYGPTESHVVTALKLTGSPGDWPGSPAIGRPIANAEVRLLDGRGQPVPIGVPGEIHIGGVALALGYRNRPQLTAERFLRHGSDDGPGARVYRTGDLGRFRSDGTIEYLGRIDHQVKIRGFRVEPGEIEASLREHPAIHDAIVVATGVDGQRRLVAHLVGDGTPPPAAELKAFLRATLPEHMIPSAFVALDAFPLTPSGKVDRVRLAAAPPGGMVEEALRLPPIERKQRLPPSPGGTAADDRIAEFPASFAQQRLWFLAQLEPDSQAYNLVLAPRLRGDLDVGALELALTELVARHESLRTTFGLVDGVPHQVIRRAGAVALPLSDLWGGPDARLRAEQLVKAESKRPFDLAGGPLFRAGLLRLAGDDHVLLLGIHRIVADTRSLVILARDLGTAYRALIAGGSPAAPALQIHYGDYAAWQHEIITSGRLDGQLQYWRLQLKGAPPRLMLPADHPRPPLPGADRGAVGCDLPRSFVERLQAVGAREQATLFMTLLTGFAGLLLRYSGQDDIVVGTPIASRQQRELEDVVGSFSNVLALRCDAAGEPSFRDLLRRVRETTLGAFAHPDLPFERLVEALDVERDLSRSPVFQAMFAVQGTDGATFELVGSPVCTDPQTPELAKSDLALIAAPRPDGLHLTLEYSDDLFDQASMLRMLGHYRSLVEAAFSEPDAAVAHLPLIDDVQRAELLALSGPEVPEPPVAGLHELFAEQAARSPDAVAVIDDVTALSYGDLDRRANQLAHHLRGLGVGPDVLVALCLEPSVETIVTVLGVLKAGGACVPVDPEDPPERLAVLLADAGAPLVVTHERWLEGLPEHAGTVICVDRDAEVLAREPMTTPAAGVDPSNLAYVMPTPAPNGRSGAVEVEHRNVTALLASAASRFDFGADDTWALLHSCADDRSVWEMWGALSRGGRLVVVPRRSMRSPEALTRLCALERITVLNAPPSLFVDLLDELLAVADHLALRTVILAGETLLPATLAPWFRHFGDDGPLLVNMYGTPETTVHATCVRLGPDAVRHPGSPIGRPLPHVELHVLDGAGGQVPIGVAGEICIGGAGVTRGYLRSPQATAERFIARPFGMSRLYRTGDRARRCDDGTLDLLGRVHDQIRLDGPMDELGAVELVAPQTATEKTLAEIWRQVLGIDRISAHDTFFGVGGHSFLAVRLLSDIEQRIGVKLPLSLLFENATFSEIAAAVQREHARWRPSPS